MQANELYKYSNLQEKYEGLYLNKFYSPPPPKKKEIILK